MTFPCPRCGDQVLPDMPCPRCLAAMAEHPSGPPVQENPLKPGDLFRGLEILGLIARGGMGIVYKARPPGVEKRLFAIKILPRSLAAEPEFADRFEREVRAMAGLGHPNIVGVHDYGVEDGLAFLIMDFVEGRGLRELLRKGRLPYAEATRIAREVCEALGAAHEQGVVHRDIKPDNVLLDPSGRVKITDFGLAKLMGADATRLTESNIVVGTPHYMAPEQMERPREVDRRADVYSFGVLLYEMLTGGLPIGRFALPSEKGAGSRELDALVLRCLEADPARRFPDAISLKQSFLRAVGSPDAAPSDRPVRARHARNVPLTCGACDWTFYVSATERGLTTCPSCRASVPIAVARTPLPEAAPPRPPTRRAEAPPPPPPARIRPATLAVGAVSAVILLGALAAAVALFRSKPPPPREQAARPPVPYDPKPLETEPEPVEAPPGDDAPAPPAGTGDFTDLDARIRRRVQRCNMAGIVSAALLHSGKLDDCVRLDDRLAAFTQEIEAFDRRKTQLSGRSSPVPPHARKGDRLYGLDDLRLDPGAPRLFAEAVKAWLKTFKAGARPVLHLTRGTSRLTIHAEFPERAKELALLAELADVTLGEGFPPAPIETGPKPLPPGLVAELEGALAALPAWYRERLLSARQDRARRLLASGVGAPDDAEYLRQRILAEGVPEARAEIEEFRARLAELEPRAAGAAAAPAADVVVFKDGRRLEGELERLGGGKLRVKKGPISMTVSEGDVLRIEKGKAPVNDFAPRWQAARGKPAELDALLRWCGERALKEARQLTAYALLLLDPGHEGARGAAGYVKDGAGDWGRAEPVAVENGTIEWNGRSYTPQELSRELSSLGYVHLNGLWHSKVSGSIKIDNLYRDAEKLLLRGGAIIPQLQNSENMVYDVRSKSWVPRARLVSTGRFLSGAPVLIEISAPGELVECRVRARGQVAQVGGTLRVWAGLFVKDPSPKLIYSLNGPGEHWQSVDVSDKVRGTSSFLIQADVGPGALFLPCDSNDLGVLEVRYVWAQPLKRLNDVLGLKSAASAPPASDVAGVENAVRRLAEAHAESRLLTDMLREMRSAVEIFAYAKEVEIPARFQGAAALIEDPLRPKLDQRPAEQILRIGEWWGALPREERQAFAYVYGLWCARARTAGR